MKKIPERKHRDTGRTPCERGGGDWSGALPVVGIERNRGRVGKTHAHTQIQRHKIGPTVWSSVKQNVPIFTNMSNRLFKLLRIKKQS